MIKVRKQKETNPFIILAFVGIANNIVWIIMTRKIKQKDSFNAAVFSLIFGFLSSVIFIDNPIVLGASGITFFMLAPMIEIFLNIDAYDRCGTINSLLNEYNIDINTLSEATYEGVCVNQDDIMYKDCMRLFENKGEVVYKAIIFHYNESKKCAEKETQKERIWSVNSKTDVKNSKGQETYTTIFNENKTIQINRGKSNKEKDKQTNNKKMDINSCTDQELSIVPGVGIILAKKAIQIRNEKGGFQSVDEFISEVGIRKSHEKDVKENIFCGQLEKKAENAKKHGRVIDF